MDPIADNSSERPLRKSGPLSPEPKAELLEAAGRTATPVKMLGWLMIGSFVFDVSAYYQGYGFRLAGVVALFVGLFVLRGSRTAIRIATIMTLVLAVTTLVEIAWICWQGHPFEAERKWVQLGNRSFFAFVVSPCIYLIGEAILAIYALRLRQIPFWTKSMKIGVGIGCVLLFLGLVNTTRNHLSETRLERDHADELSIVRDHVVNLAGSMSYEASCAKFDSFPQISRIQWWHYAEGYIAIHDRNHARNGPIMFGEPSSPTRRHTEWIKDSSGKWGKLVIYFVTADSP